MQTKDFEQAGLVIAFDEQEHRSYMEKWFSDWADRIEYWQVGDLHITTAEEALSVVDVEVRALVQRLSSSRPSPRIHSDGSPCSLLVPDNLRQSGTIWD